MKSFRFRMQVVLEQRERQEQAAKLSFAEAESALRCGQELLCELREVRAAILEELSHSQGAMGFDPLLTRLYQDYLQTIAQGIRDQERYVGDLTTTCEAHKLHLISAAQSRQALVSVRDRAKMAHTLHAQRVEQAALDEMATARHNYRQRGTTE
ncbi:MAG: flagellar export protein FliJ [Armatimonadetes bacterium]|nr:flagellar export protein FliJ [Armatimonadota bacterium]